MTEIKEADSNQTQEATQVPAQLSTSKTKEKVNLPICDEKQLKIALEKILEKEIGTNEQQLFIAIEEAGKITKVSTKDVIKGCGGKVVLEIATSIAEKFNG